jgi:hypothetical protein
MRAVTRPAMMSVMILPVKRRLSACPFPTQMRAGLDLGEVPAGLRQKITLT